MQHDDTRRSIGRRIGGLHRRMMAFVDREMADMGLNHTTFHFMSLVFMREGLRQEELARTLCVDKATATRAISHLEELGYVDRIADPSDRRARLVRPSARALRMRERFRATLRRLTDVLTHGFTAGERATAGDLLDRMLENMTSRLDGRNDTP